MSHAVQHRFGRLPVRHDARTLHFANYARPSLVAPPVRSDWYSKVTKWPMMLNDQLGDCTCAAAGHMIEAWTLYGQGREAQVTDQQILAAYETVSGYNPVTGEGDDGAVELDVLKVWRSKGIAGHKIKAFLRVDPHNHRQLKQAISLFGGVYAGFQVPQSAEDQFAAGQEWHVTKGSPIIGGHAVPIMGYDPQNYQVVTWGAVQQMTGRFLDTYFDEAYAIVTQDFLDRTGHDPQGLDLQQLLADLDALD